MEVSTKGCDGGGGGGGSNGDGDSGKLLLLILLAMSCCHDNVAILSRLLQVILNMVAGQLLFSVSSEVPLKYHKI